MPALDLREVKSHPAGIALTARMSVQWGEAAVDGKDNQWKALGQWYAKLNACRDVEIRTENATRTRAGRKRERFLCQILLCFDNDIACPHAPAEISLLVEIKISHRPGQPARPHCGCPTPGGNAEDDCPPRGKVHEPRRTEFHTGPVVHRGAERRRKIGPRSAGVNFLIPIPVPPETIDA